MNNFYVGYNSDWGSFFRDICCACDPSELMKIVDAVIQVHPFSDKGMIDPEDILAGYRPIFLYGAGRFAQSVIENWEKINRKPDFCVDSNPVTWGKSIKGIFILSPEALFECKEPPLVVVTAMINSSIQEQLADYGIPCLFAERNGKVGYLPGHHLRDKFDSFKRVWGMLADEYSRQTFLAVAKARIFQCFNFEMLGSPFLNHVAVGSQYFPKDIFGFSPNEMWVDCGAYDGDFLVSGYMLMHQLGYPPVRAHAFEADSLNTERLCRTIAIYHLKDVIIHHILVGAKDGWCENPDFNNCRQEKDRNTFSVQTSRLDTVLAGSEVNYIKMDIEGAELNALEGAFITIEKWRPKLAICMYHETAHLLDIPLFINSNFQDYKIYIRHHSSNSLWETVCYAVPN